MGLVLESFSLVMNLLIAIPSLSRLLSYCDFDSCNRRGSQYEIGSSLKLL